MCVSVHVVYYHPSSIDIAEAHYAQIIALLISGVWGPKCCVPSHSRGSRIQLKVVLTAKMNILTEILCRM